MPFCSSDDWQQNNYIRYKDYQNEKAEIEEKNNEVQIEYDTSDEKMWDEMTKVKLFYNNLPKSIQEQIQLPCSTDNLYKQANDLLKLFPMKK